MGNVKFVLEIRKKAIKQEGEKAQKVESREETRTLFYMENRGRGSRGFPSTFSLTF